MRTNRANWLLPLLLSAGSAIFTLFLEEWLKIISTPLFSNEAHAIWAGLAIVAVLSLFVLMAILFFARRAEDREHKWLRIEDRLGTPAEIEFEPVEIGIGKFNRRVSEYVRKAAPGDEIVVMAHYRLDHSEESPRVTQQYIQSRQEYSQALIEKAKEPNITYRRIICFDEGPQHGKICARRVKEWVIDHAKQMVELRKVKPGKVTLKKSKVIFGPDVLIIKNKMAAISLDIHDADGRAYTSGVLIFHNPPNGDIIQQLYELFMMADNESTPVDKVPEE